MMGSHASGVVDTGDPAVGLGLAPCRPLQGELEHVIEIARELEAVLPAERSLHDALTRVVLGPVSAFTAGRVAPPRRGIGVVLLNAERQRVKASAQRDCECGDACKAHAELQGPEVEVHSPLPRRPGDITLGTSSSRKARA